MLRCGNQIRFTSEKEKQDFRSDTGRTSLPTTAEEYNRAMQQAREAWKATDTPEGRLLAMMLPDLA